MKTNARSTSREKKMGMKIKKPSRMFMSWKTLIPAVAALGVGGYFIRGRRGSKLANGSLAKQ